jgi:hypothetical protein
VNVAALPAKEVPLQVIDVNQPMPGFDVKPEAMNDDTGAVHRTGTMLMISLTALPPVRPIGEYEPKLPPVFPVSKPIASIGQIVPCTS